MAYIRTIHPDQASGELAKLYEKIAGPGGDVDNILLSHSLRPHTLEGHMELYKAVLHHRDNALPKWFLEVIGVFVSHHNHCAYCVDHHLAGLKRLLRDDARFEKMTPVLRDATDDPVQLKTVFSEKECAALIYASNLTKNPGLIDQDDIKNLRVSGLHDGEILEINQVTAYFAYANRTVLGLGCTVAGDTLGLSPSDNSDPKNWQHK